MTSIKDLVDASKNTYQYQAHAKENGVQDYRLFTTTFDEKSNHSGLSYVNDKTGEVILAHRGTDFTKLKDIVTDMQIALNWKETKADMAAVKFTESVIDDLIDQGFDIKKVIQTGHSLGGRLAQHSMKNLIQTSDYKAESITFNSARVSTHDTEDQEYDHLNLRAKGKGILTTDLVTSYGNHLGNTVDIELPEVKNFIQAHRLTTFDLMETHYNKAFTEIPIGDLISLSKESNDLSLLQPITLSVADKISSVLNIDINSISKPIVISAELGKSYSGEVIAETPKEYIQQLGENSKFFALHDKNNLQNSLSVGDKVQIKYPKDVNKKASVQEDSKLIVKSKSR